MIEDSYPPSFFLCLGGASGLPKQEGSGLKPCGRRSDSSGQAGVIVGELLGWLVPIMSLTLLAFSVVVVVALRDERKVVPTVVTRLVDDVGDRFVEDPGWGIPVVGNTESNLCVVPAPEMLFAGLGDSRVVDNDAWGVVRYGDVGSFGVLRHEQCTFGCLGVTGSNSRRDFGGSGLRFDRLQGTEGDPRTDASYGGEKPSKYSRDETGHGGHDSPPLGRRAAIAFFGLFAWAVGCLGGAWLIVYGDGYARWLGWAGAAFGLLSFWAGLLLLWLTPFRFTWGWWL